MAGQTLRDYQARGVAQIFEAWKQGARSVLAVSPTGSGKTSLFTWILSQISPKPSLINVHRRELATQASNRLREFGIDYGFIMAGEQPKPYAPVQIASVQSLVRRKTPPAVLIVNDEAHLSTAQTWQTIMGQYPDARILGVSATPWRLSGKPLAAQYDAVVVVATPRELREQGHLCPFTGYSYRTPDLSGIKTTGGDYNEKQSAEAMGTVVDTVVEEWLLHSSHLSTVVFAVTVEHSKTLCQKFRDAGVTAEHLDGKTPKEQRAAILQRVTTGQTRVLCNVGVAVEGLDIPRLKCCVLARPTQSLSRYLQMVGRVMRPWEGVTARVHDHAFCVVQHGLPDDDRDYRLDATKEEQNGGDIESITTCPKCLALYRGPVCTACAEPRPVGERKIHTVTDVEKIDFADMPQQEQSERKPVEVRWNDIGRMIEGIFKDVTQEPASYGTQKQYLIEGEKRNYKLPGTKRLDALMRTVPKGTKVRVTFTGETQLPKGMRRKEFKVEIDEDSVPTTRVQSEGVYLSVAPFIKNACVLDPSASENGRTLLREFISKVGVVDAALFYRTLGSILPDKIKRDESNGYPSYTFRGIRLRTLKQDAPIMTMTADEMYAWQRSA